jgi:hypothetical protein
MKKHKQYKKREMEKQVAKKILSAGGLQLGWLRRERHSPGYLRAQPAN